MSYECPFFFFVTGALGDIKPVTSSRFMKREEAGFFLGREERSPRGIEEKQKAKPLEKFGPQISSKPIFFFWLLQLKRALGFG